MTLLRLVDLILLLVVLEGVVLARRLGTSGVLFLGSGAALMLALRAALAGWRGEVILLCLAASGVLHALQLRAMWRRGNAA